MKITLGQVFIAVVLTGLSYAKTGKAQIVLNRPVTISINNSTLGNALKKLERYADVKFVYSKSMIETDKQVNIDVNQLPLEAVLDKLLIKNGIAYEILNNRIILTKSKDRLSTDNTGQTVIAEIAFPVSGRVMDENGQPMPGVSVRLNNSDQGTITDVNGAFTINVNAPTDALTFSFIGYETKRIVVGTSRVFNVQLQLSRANSLEEVVVVGYGTSTKANLTTSVGSVKGETIRERPNSINVVQGLQGRIAGVNVMVNSGKPGGNPTIKIRGVGSINTSSDPLYVIDGFLGADPQNIDPTIVESVDVLKDAAATAIYGSRGANGVVLITTRRGKANTSEITISNTLSFGSVARKINVLDANGALEMIRRQYDYVPGRGVQAPNLPTAPADPAFTRKADLFNADGTPKYNTDWVKESTRLSVSDNHSIAFSGGTDKLNVLANINYRNNQGIMLNSYDKRISGFINIGWQVKPWLDIQMNLNTGAHQGNNVDLDPLSSTAIRKMYEFLPFYPVKYPDGTNSRQGDFPGREDSENPVTLLNGIKNTVGGTYSIANIIGTFHLTKDLDLVTQLGGQTEGNYDFYYAGRDLVGVSKSVGGRARRTHTNIGNWTNEDYLSYKHNFGKHYINVVGGVSWYSNYTTLTTTNATGFFDDYFSFNAVQAGSVTPPPTSDWLSRKTNSVYARANYNYDNRYLLGASFRRDGASVFGTDTKIGYFPSFSAGWNVANEAFFKESGIAKTINSFKIRGSYGVVGNSEIPSYRSLTILNTISYPVTRTASGTVITAGTIGNPLLSWESSKQTNIAVDMGFFNNRLNITADYYNKVNSKLLLNKNLPATTGYTSVFQNIGDIRNRGLELSVTSVNIDNKDFRWNTSANFTANKSKVLKLNGQPIFGTWGGWIAEGRPLNEFYGFVRQGVWGTAEATQAAKYFKLPGDTKWQDTNNNGVKDLGDRVPLGNGMPKWEANLSNTFNYKGVSLLIDVEGMYGLSLINTGKHLMQNVATRVNSFKDILNAWTPTHQNTNIPALRTAADPGSPSEVADSYAVEDGSFLRVRNIGLSYRLTAPWLKNIVVKSITIGVNVENALLFTKYSGFDPEFTSLDGQLNQGVDIYQYPKPRVVSFTLNANF